MNCMCAKLKCKDGDRAGRYKYDHQGGMKGFDAETIDECIRRTNMAIVGTQFIAIQTGFKDDMSNLNITVWNENL